MKMKEFGPQGAPPWIRQCFPYQYWGGHPGGAPRSANVDVVTLDISLHGGIKQTTSFSKTFY